MLLTKSLSTTEKESWHFTQCKQMIEKLENTILALLQLQYSMSFVEEEYNKSAQFPTLAAAVGVSI